MSETVYRVNDRPEPELAGVRFAVDYGSALKLRPNIKSLFVAEHIGNLISLTNPLAERGFGRGISALPGMYTGNGRSYDDPVTLSRADTEDANGSITVTSMDIPDVISLSRLKKTFVEFRNDYRGRMGDYSPENDGNKGLLSARAAIGGLVKRVGITAFEAASKEAQDRAIEWGLGGNVMPDAYGNLLLRINSGFLAEGDGSLKTEMIRKLYEVSSDYGGAVKYATEVDSNEHSMSQFKDILKGLNQDFPEVFLLSSDLAWITRASAEKTKGFTSADMLRALSELVDDDELRGLMVALEINPFSENGHGHVGTEHDITDHKEVGRIISAANVSTIFHETGPTINNPADQIARNTDGIIEGLMYA